MVADIASPDELALLQQHTTEQKLAAVQPLVQWLLDNHAQVRVTCFSEADQKSARKQV
jgi:hypothetical protein